MSSSKKAAIKKTVKKLSPQPKKLTLAEANFCAIDFETANYSRNSACALAIVKVECGKIVDEWHQLIRPPTPHFIFSYLHGIEWEHVANKPDFSGHYNSLMSAIDGSDFIAAHNASFDKGVLYTCCETAALAPPKHPFCCTVKLARRAWNIRPTTLAHVSHALGLSLKHHDALSDARACANIVLRAITEEKDVLGVVRYI